MNPTGRIVAVSTGTALLVGFVTVGLVVLANESPKFIRYTLTTGKGFLGLLSIAAFTAVPISIVAGAGGGLLAARVASREREVRGLASWLGHGFLWGTSVGAVLTAIFFVGLNVGNVMLLHVLLLAATGGAPGGICGALVGAYCGRIVAVKRTDTA